MLRFLFWSLLAVNGLLLAFNLGYLGSWNMDAHEPQRIKNQYQPGQLQLVSAAVANAVADPNADKKGAVTACVEIGDFLQADLPRIEDRLKQLALGDRQSRTNVQDIASHMVYIPSMGSKEGADKKAGELRRLGITDFYVIQDQSNLRWGISLGIFKSEDSAKAHLATLNNKGVRSARIGARSVTTNKFAYQLRALSAEEQAKFDSIKADFPTQEVRNCQATAYNKN
ncbi:SPOR domain-containing protein [Undibacterium sp. TJN25]|uniref:SPOR domain-containing protein n=1 Tax=Undibacterium sp. TJN25 TaxID=3413056 RepID=UPI003BF0ACC4